jgi:hypothetical protein
MLGKTAIPQAPMAAIPPPGAKSVRADDTVVARASEPAEGLTADQEARIEAMVARDREVREHEQAHSRVGGPYAGSPSYEYEVGPDNNLYAVAGEVPIDVTPVRDDPEATLAKMTIVEAAALAPPEPSATDRAVAALARAQRMQALAEMQAQKRQGLSVRL